MAVEDVRRRAAYGSVANSAHHSDTTGVGHGRREFWSGGNIHAGQHNGMFNLQEVGDRGTDLLCVHHK